MYLLPLNNSATKRIIEGAQYCDIYTLPTATDYQQMVEGFLKFVEIVVNKIKKPGLSKKPRVRVNFYLLKLILCSFAT